MKSKNADQRSSSTNDEECSLHDAEIEKKRKTWRDSKKLKQSHISYYRFAHNCSGKETEEQRTIRLSKQRMRSAEYRKSKTEEEIVEIRRLKVRQLSRSEKTRQPIKSFGDFLSFVK